MTRSREALKRQTHPGWLILWVALAGLGLWADLGPEPVAIQLEDLP